MLHSGQVKEADMMIRIVERDLATALVLEDDIDWDVGLKSIIHQIALSTNALMRSNFSNIDFATVPSVPVARTTPYGDDWDVIWLGHCEMHLPPYGILTIHNDPTVPEHRHLRSFIETELTPLVSYPEHTRTVFLGTREGTCSLAYAVTQSAARRMLYQIGIEKLQSPFRKCLSWCPASNIRSLSTERPNNGG